MCEYILTAIAAVVLIIASITDVKMGKIRNLLTVPAICVGLIAAGVFISPREALIRTLMIIVLFFFSFLRLIGNGDIKLTMALTALVGFFPAVLTVAVGSALVLLYWLVKDRRNALNGIGEALDALKLGTVAYLDKSSGSIPFAPFMLAGYVIVCIGRFLIC